MWTINIQDRGAHIGVRLLHWARDGRYPRPLCDFELIAATGESELALLARCARAVELECEARRLEAYPELPF